jgi:hypothetical protein
MKALELNSCYLLNPESFIIAMVSLDPYKMKFFSISSSIVFRSGGLNSCNISMSFRIFKRLINHLQHHVVLHSLVTRPNNQTEENVEREDKAREVPAW